MTTDVDILIIGAGPAGLFGAYYAGARGLSVAVIDSLSQLGGQVTAMYPEKQIYDIAGLPAVSGRDLVRGLVDQATQYESTFILGEEAQLHERLPEGSLRRHQVTTSSGKVVRCGAVIVTGGIGTFTPRPLPAGEDFLGRGLDYFVPDSAEYAGKDVLVVGGGDSAIDWCLTLESIAASVTLVHRREQFRAHAASVTEVRSSSVRIVTNAEVVRLDGGAVVEKATYQLKGGEASTVPCQKVVAALGFTANLGPLREWELELANNRHIVVDSAMRTNQPGIFAAGDITDYDGKVRLIAVGFGEVATAVNNAAVYIDPDAQLFPGHSTDTPHQVSLSA
ncbi:NAD(P)/FAD-dependent oxidoreductase (plasmid) [Nocardioides sp. R1-1]|uniref:NAD(P)/FAD-dependent oxidoreductase n=1 Tax=Nocardioides sp. R1-1 TaxID=3383502 RepID=UPI0038CFB1B8